MTQDLTLILQAQDMATRTLQSLRGQINRLNSSAINLAKAGFTSMKNTWSKVEGALKTGVTVGLIGLIGAIGLAAKTSMGFQTTMLGVKAVSGATEEQFESLRNKAKELGRTTQYSATQSASAIEMLAKNGLTYDQIIGGAIDSTLSLAAATGSELSASADLATDAMTNFNIEAKDMVKAVDGITGVTVNSKFDMNDYAYALANAGGVAGSMGVTFEEFNATIAGISPGFKAGEGAGTSFKTFLQRLTPQSKAASDLMKQIGFSAYDAAGQLKSMPEIAQSLQDSLKGMTDEAKNSALGIMFGSDAIQAGIKISEMGAEGYKKLMDQIARVSAAEQAAIRMGGLQGAILLVKSATEGLMIDLFDLEIGGKSLIDWVLVATRRFAGFVGKINLQGLVNQFTNFIKRGLEKAAPIIKLLGGRMETLKTIFAGFAGALTAIITPAIVILTAKMLLAAAPFVIIGLLVAGLYKLWTNNFGGIQERTARFVEYWKTSLQPAIEEFIKTTWTKLVNAYNDFRENTLPLLIRIFNYFKTIILEETVPALKELWEVFVSDLLPIIQKVWAFIQTYIIPLLGVILVGATYIAIKTFNLFVGTLKNVIKWFKKTYDNAKKFIGGVVDFVVGLLTGDWSRAWDGAKTIVKTATDQIINALNLVIKPIKWILGKLGVIDSGFKHTSSTANAEFQKLANNAPMGPRVPEFSPNTVPGFNVGTSHFKGGVADIHQDERVILPAGSKVQTASSAQRDRASGGGGANITFSPTINFSSLTKPSKADQKEMADSLQDMFLAFLKKYKIQTQ